MYLCKLIDNNTNMKRDPIQLFAGMSHLEKVEYALMLLMTVAVAIHWTAGVWCMAALILVAAAKCIVTRRIGNPALSRSAKVSMWLMIALWVLHAVSALYSSHPDEAWSRAMMMLPMLLLPLLFLLDDLSYLRRQHLSALVFLLAGVLTVRFGLMLCRAVYHYFYTGIPLGQMLDYHEYHFDYMHHNYMSMYLIATIALLYAEVARCWHRPEWRRWRWAVAADMLLLSGYMVIMGSRSGLVVFALMAGACLLHMALVRKRWAATGAVLALLLVAVGASYAVAPRMYWRIVYSAEKMLAGEPGDGRQIMWQCGMELVEGHELIGWGCDGYWEALRERYRAHDFAEGYEPERYNTHNQYLETLIALGMMGAVVLVAMVVMPAVVALRRHSRNLPMLLFTVVYAGCLVFEVMFGRQMGLLFICWWYGVLQHRFSDCLIV